MESTQVARPFKPRRPHKKSRNGCQYCRRRRIKCDETRPQCNRCAGRNQPCEYLTQSTSPKEQSPTPSPTIPSGSTDMSNDRTTSEPQDSGYEASPLFTSSLEHTPIHSDATPPIAQVFAFDQEPFLLPPSTPNEAFNDTTTGAQDLYLLDYYLDHLGNEFVAMPATVFAMSVGLPKLASRHKGLLSSVIALGAARLCIDILMNHVSTGISCHDIVELIRTGDRYHRQGIDSVRRDIASIDPNNLRLLQLQAVMVFPYALAKRRILRLLHSPNNHLISNGSNIPFEFLPDSPINLDWVVCLRGVATTSYLYKAGRASANDESDADCYIPEHQALDTIISTQVLEKVSRHAQHHTLGSLDLRNLGSRHPLFSILSTTRESAFEHLQQKIDNLQRRVRKLQHKNFADSYQIASMQQVYSSSLAACTLATDFLASTADRIFDEYAEQAPYSLLEDLSHTWQAQLCSTPTYHPDQPMIHMLLSWINRVPSEYMNLLLKPLPSTGYDSQNISPQSVFREVDLEIQLMAWDIYAHWLVFTILTENERWYVSDLGVSDIIKVRELLELYSSPGSSESAPSSKSEREYWPSAMRTLAQQLRVYQNQTPIL